MYDHAWARIRIQQQMQEHENLEEVQQFNNLGELMEWLKQPDQTKRDGEACEVIQLHLGMKLDSQMSIGIRQVFLNIFDLF